MSAIPKTLEYARFEARRNCFVIAEEGIDRDEEVDRLSL